LGNNRYSGCWSYHVCLGEVQGWEVQASRNDALAVSRVTYSAIEEANNKDVKVLVAEALNEMGKANPGMLEINNVMTSVVDSEKASSVPPLKRFWRRALAGQNLAGIAAKIAAKAAIEEYLRK